MIRNQEVNKENKENQTNNKRTDTKTKKTKRTETRIRKPMKNIQIDVNPMEIN